MTVFLNAVWDIGIKTQISHSVRNENSEMITVQLISIFLLINRLMKLMNPPVLFPKEEFDLFTEVNEWKKTTRDIKFISSISFT